MAHISSGDGGVVGVEEVDRLLRAAHRLEAKGNDAAAARAFAAARRLWDEQQPAARSVAADLDGVRSGVFVLREE